MSNKKGVKRCTKGGKRPQSSGFAAEIETRMQFEARMGQSVGRISEQEQMLVAMKRIGILGEKTLLKLHAALTDVKQEYSQIVMEDAKDDKEIAYSKYKFDQELKVALGKYFLPWEERYDPVPYTTGIRTIEILEQRRQLRDAIAEAIEGE